MASSSGRRPRGSSTTAKSRTKAKVVVVVVGEPVVVGDNKVARAAASTSTGMEAGKLPLARTHVAGTLRCASPSRLCATGQEVIKHGE